MVYKNLVRAFSDYYELEVFYYDNNGFDLFTKDSNYITAPEEAEINLSDIATNPVKTSVTTDEDSNSGRYTLKTKIPVKSSTNSSLYNLVYMYNKVDKDNKGKVYAPIEIKLPFTNPTDLLKNDFLKLESIKFHTTLNVRNK